MRHRILLRIALAASAAGLPSAALAEWTLATNEGPDSQRAVFITRATTYEGAVAFVCENSSAGARAGYILVVTTSFTAALGRLDVTTTIGAKPPMVMNWTAEPRDNRLRSREVDVTEFFAALAGEPGMVFEMVDDFGRTYRVAAPVENLLDLTPEFLAQCAALPPPPLRRF